MRPGGLRRRLPERPAGHRRGRGDGRVLLQPVGGRQQRPHRRLPQRFAGPGLWQINNCYHPTVNDTCAYNAQCNANAAYSISSGGGNWQPWSTYNNGAYAGYLSAAQAAVARLGGTGDPPAVTGTILANPSLNIRTGPGTTYGIAGSVAYGTTVRIACYTFGEYVSGGYWSSSTWDRITNPATGVTGYVADTWVNTTYDVKTMVGRC